MKTKAPSRTNCLAVARPMPLVPPVMSAVFPSSLPILFLLERRDRPAGSSEMKESYVKGLARRARDSARKGKAEAFSPGSRTVGGFLCNNSEQPRNARARPDALET